MCYTELQMKEGGNINILIATTNGQIEKKTLKNPNIFIRDFVINSIGNDCKSLENVRPIHLYQNTKINPNVIMIVDGDGYYKRDLQVNHIADQLYGSNNGFHIMGNVVFAALSNEGDYISLSDEMIDQLMKLLLVL